MAGPLTTVQGALLNVEVVDTLFEAQVLVERWRKHYNTVRPHSALWDTGLRYYMRTGTTIGASMESEVKAKRIPVTGQVLDFARALGRTG